MLILKVFILLFIVLNSAFGYSQGSFELPKTIEREIFSFTLKSNRVIVPIKINGVELDFLLDSGVNATILFSLENKDSIQLNNAKSIKLKGLGEGK